jgi:hypothetical protein
MSLANRTIVVCGMPAMHGDVTRALQARGAKAIAVVAGMSVEDALTASPDIDSAVVCVSGQASLRACHDWSLTTWAGQVTEPLRRTTMAVRELLSFWLGEGTIGNIALLHIGGNDDGSVVVRHGLDALARSVAKEYGRRDMRCNVVASPLLTSAATDLAALALSPSLGFVTGQRLEARS